MSDRAFHVALDARPCDRPSAKGAVQSVGVLRFEQARAGSVVSFEYDPSWLSRQPVTAFDPDLQPWSGRQYVDPSKPLFGVFGDSCPDRWGRTLLQRKENEDARLEGRTARILQEPDFLAGVSDQTRMGALRYSLDADGPFVAAPGEGVPPFSSLCSLEEASRQVETDKGSLRRDAALDLLLSPGSSLGGARPKANVVDQSAGLWVAKFPSAHDRYDMGLVEFLTHELAREFGIDVPEANRAQVSRHGTVFLSRRFDREGPARFHFSSAMALLGKRDGASGSDGTSYLELVEFIRENCAHPQRDLEELFRRIVFSVAVSNTDDHLRNHGFLLGSEGWHLAPAYDVNPNPAGRSLSLNIDEASGALSFRLVVEQAAFFGLPRSKAERMVGEVSRLLKSWETRARRLRLSAADCASVAPAFDLSGKE